LEIKHKDAMSSKIRPANIVEPGPPRKEKKRKDIYSANASAFAQQCLALYEIYPKKVGKKLGLSRCQKKIKTKGALEDLSRAVANYTKSCENKGTDKQFIKQFDTFMNCYEEWINPTEDMMGKKKGSGSSEFEDHGKIDTSDWSTV